MERRLQTASEELREANEKIVELQEQLTKARSSAAKLAQRSHEPGWFDWEAEKRRILAALEADAEGEDATQKRERLGIEEVLRMNDAVIAMKDREIQELKRGLDSRGNGPMTEESALRQAVNADVAIQEERARLQQLQKEWREKLRQAEVELSLERAKIARERAELDEQLRSMTDSRGKIAADVVAQDSAEHGSSGRWLAQLGLTAADREPTRH
jgi:chromosome segregation ATPase